MAGILDRFRLEGQVALVTGGSSGIGLTIAHGLHEAGAAVVLAARCKGPLAEAVASLAPRTAACAADVGDRAALALRDAPAARRGNDDMVVRVDAAGICGSDLHAHHGQDPRRLRRYAATANRSRGRLQRHHHLRLAPAIPCATDWSRILASASGQPPPGR